MPRPARKIRVLLDRSHQRFVPQAPVGAQLVGIVERGMQIGALARMPDGTYVQVNGDVVQALNRCQVESALQEARLDLRRRGASLAAAPQRPVVTIKRRRTVAAPSV